MNLRTRVGLHLAACAAATVAGSSSAAIVWSGIINLNVPSNIDGVYLNVVTGATGTAGSAVAGWDVNPYSTSATALTWWAATGAGLARGGGSSTTLVDNLAFGTVINSALSYGTGQSETTGATAFNLNSDQNLVGFRFVNEAGGGTHYGWMRMQISASLGSQPRAIVEYAYEGVAGVGITAGTIPAPGAVALLGLAGLAGRRRRA